MRSKKPPPVPPAPLTRTLLHTKEACKYLGVSRSTLYKLANLYGLRRYRLGGARWPIEELNRVVQMIMEGVKRDA